MSKINDNSRVNNIEWKNLVAFCWDFLDDLVRNQSVFVNQILLQFSSMVRNIIKKMKFNFTQTSNENSKIYITSASFPSAFLCAFLFFPTSFHFCRSKVLSEHWSTLRLKDKKSP